MKVAIGKTNNMGKGVFALKDIKKGELIFTLIGDVIRNRDYVRELKCTFQIDENKWINPQKGSLGRYINHSCKPNAGINCKKNNCCNDGY